MGPTSYGKIESGKSIRNHKTNQYLGIQKKGRLSPPMATTRPFINNKNIGHTLFDHKINSLIKCGNNVFGHNDDEFRSDLASFRGPSVEKIS